MLRVWGGEGGGSFPEIVFGLKGGTHGCEMKPQSVWHQDFTWPKPPCEILQFYHMARGPCYRTSVVKFLILSDKYCFWKGTVLCNEMYVTG